MATYLVLGSSGQIGATLTKFLRKNGEHEVIEFDIARSAQEDLRIHQNPLLDAAMARADFVFFLAFDVGGSRYLKKYQTTYDFVANNTTLMQETFAALKKHGKPLIFASSQMSNMSYSAYGRLKAIGEAYTQALNGLVVKFWNVYGIEHDLEKAHVITDFILKAKTNGIIDLLTDGTEERQFLFAEDCSKALVTLADHYATIPRDKELHITNFTWSSILEVAQCVARIFPGTKILPGKAHDEVQRDKRNEPDPFILQYWKPETSLEEGVKYVAACMEQQAILVSTITPCFRMKPYLKRFLDELPRQTYFDRMEVILDHNEPDDEEIAWVQEFQKTYPGRLKHIIVPKVEPIGPSMNRCIREAQGTWLTIWNVDDLRTPRSIEAMVKAGETKQGDIVFGDYVIVRSFGSTEGRLIEHAHIPESEFTRSMVFGPFVMFKKSLCAKAGVFDEQLKSGADFDLSIRLALHGKAVTADECLGYYLNEGKGASTRPDSLQAVERTVIELRYGIFDKINYSLVPRTNNYRIPDIIINGIAESVDRFVPEYASWVAKRHSMWTNTGMIRWMIRTVLHIDPIKQQLKRWYKKLFWRQPS